MLEDIREAVAKQAPEIAGPVIDKAEQDGKITEAQADKLRQAAQDLADGKRPDIRGLGRDADVHEVIHDAFAAAAEKAPGIAEPIIDKAVADKKITEAQADRIRAMVKRGARPSGPGPALASDAVPTAPAWAFLRTSPTRTCARCSTTSTPRSPSRRRTSSSP